MVNDRPYAIACDDGEEAHLRELAAHVDAKVRELLDTVGQVGDARLMLMAALLITDDYFDALTRLEQSSQEIARLAAARDILDERVSLAEAGVVSVLEVAAKRAEDIAARLRHA
jgi:cell division protein ZapA